ncbi:hypothetical protein [Polaribacter cellanae]|uniref:Discoidin domain-containing protein n=1 Tax=Polaribacter cellanae TaxID=2818493 RepID=A0A975H805_9FLAO|nr:hypothetical protein [Polaribacter cellanae]QTE23534.1 hypothetical protein J3359_04425 [Polaribacter cellanae]
MRYILFFFLLTFLISSCEKYDTNVEEALILAGKNREELEKVLDYYQKPKDSLKYKAACVLISTMPYQFYKDGKKLQHILNLKGTLHKKFDKYSNVKNRFYSRNIRTEIFKKYIDTIELKYGKISFSDLNTFYDIENITSQFLIENIEYAFMAWELPWAKHLNFDEFCEYILPYRSGQQKPNSWRKFYFNKFKLFRDSLSNEKDPVKVCKILNKLIRNDGFGVLGKKVKKFKNSVPGPYMTELGLSGDCVSISNRTIEVMRSNGIPITEIFIDKFGRNGHNHMLNAVMDTLGGWKIFNGYIQDPGKFIPREDITKVYKKRNLLEYLNLKKQNNIEKKLNHIGWEDITKQVTSVFNVSIKVPNSNMNKKKAYLCIFNPNSKTGWTPIEGTVINNNNALFENIGGKNVIYLTMIENEYGELSIPIGLPFKINPDGTKTNLNPQKELLFFEFNRKFPPNKGFEKRAELLIGGRFEGASYSDFRDAKVIFRIKKKPKQYNVIYKVNEENKYKYVRFCYPESKFTDLAEISFFNTKINKLKGKYIYSEGVSDENMDIIFDSDELSYVQVLHYDGVINKKISNKIILNKTNNIWVGLELGESTKITHIGFCPRNDKNNINVGMTYELLFWDKEWKSLGQKKATSNKISYSNIPQGALLWLRNHTEGIEERIFTIENNKVIWW